VSNFFPARTIAKANRIAVDTVRYRARRGRWPVKWQGKRVKYLPPGRLQRLLKPALNEQRLLRELLRAVAVAGFMLELRRNAKCGIERALIITASKYRHLFKFSPFALRRWVIAVQRGGLAALQERKAGVVGRKPFRLERILR
jgi:hypothetical protein